LNFKEFKNLIFDTTFEDDLTDNEKDMLGTIEELDNMINEY